MIKRVIVGATIAAAGWATYRKARRWWTTWGVDPAEAARALPGDDLVADPSAVDTRGITIDAPPEAVWPWLVQMGFGRAGWYSYDRLDMRGTSADRLVPEWQQLTVGDTLPTHPAGGFEVKVLEAGRALVAYIDTAIAERWKAAEAAPAEVAMPPGLAASGGLLEASMPHEFAASWAFVVEPAGDRQTRLIERFRFKGGDAGPGPRALASILGVGVFVMTQRHMTGIRQRAERLAAEGTVGASAQPATRMSSEPAAASTNGHDAPVGPTGTVATPG